MPKRLPVWDYLEQAQKALSKAELVVPFDVTNRQDIEVRKLIKQASGLIERADGLAYSYGRHG